MPVGEIAVGELAWDERTALAVPIGALDLPKPQKRGRPGSKPKPKRDRFAPNPETLPPSAEFLPAYERGKRRRTGSKLDKRKVSEEALQMMMEDLGYWYEELKGPNNAAAKWVMDQIIDRPATREPEQPPAPKVTLAIGGMADFERHHASALNTPTTADARAASAAKKEKGS